MSNFNFILSPDMNIYVEKIIEDSQKEKRL